MEKIKVYIVLSLLMMYGHNMYAQIGYQISLLNTATGEPRANETVNVTMTLTNSEGKVIYTGNQSATTNDFGVLSLTIGDADTFKEVDFTKMPFYIEVTANGVAIGKSQVLNVPVAEYAKRTGTLTKELLVGTWVKEYGTKENMKGEYYTVDGENSIRHEYTYTSYYERLWKYVFNGEGGVVHVFSEKYWSVGRLDTEGNPNDSNFSDTETMNGEYIIDGDDVIILRQRHIAGTITHSSSQYASMDQEYLHYVGLIRVLGNGYTKQ